jgi:UDP-N-acetylmuramoyl-L-alanyl-D-glutamate--2,6-diaminopimelate ligase
VLPATADLGKAQISHITHDSREIRTGTLFVCIRGANTDGHLFAKAAEQSGAVALLVDHEVSGVGIPQIVVLNTRESMGHFAAAVYGFPADKLTLIAVTGTNGKTTVAHMIETVLRADGREARVIGTLTQTRTTPEATDLQYQLAAYLAEGVTTVVMEVTSHALELFRVAGLHFRIGVFTNLSQDHLDFHGTMETYFRAKAKLFTALYVDQAIVNVDDTHGRLLRDAAMVPTEGFSIEDVSELALAPDHSSFLWRGTLLRVPMSGRFNVANALAAANVAATLGVSLETIAIGIAQVGVPGRYELIHAGQSFSVVVDFAHTPDGLERVLEAARSSLVDGRLISVVGCGGDRDRAKRPLMAAIAQRFSNICIFTSDNPRSEDPMDIVHDMLAGIDMTLDQPQIELDRRAAILIAVTAAKRGDIVVIAGKGHESGQEVAGVKTPFDDRDVARELLSGLGPGGQ